MSAAPFDFSPGSTPLLISVPHAGRDLPAELLARLSAEGLAQPDTDWHVPRLYDFARELGAGFLVANLSRYVIDLNRDPSGAALYPGAENTELCPGTSFASLPLYRAGEAPGPEEIEARRRQYFDPYHRTLREELTRLHARHGYALLLDAHSIRSEVPRFFPGKLPDLNLGSAGGRSATPELERLAYATLAEAKRFTAVLNGRFQGGFITRHYGQPESGWFAMQLEIAQCAYLDEAAPEAFDAARAAELVALLRRFITRLLGWR